ncbi:MAG: c-type cytochrome [Planctomycetes bacterium]|nr:c-type cytochrome [Planctomycetota bacterium]
MFAGYKAQIRQLLIIFMCGCFAACVPELLAEDASKTPAPPAEMATDPTGLRVLPGFEVELLYSVPLATQGSWVSMTADPQGRLIVCDQRGHLYRVTPSPLGTSSIESVETIDVDLGEAQGLLYAFDSLYVMVNKTKDFESGLYQVRDTDGDDKFDSVELLHALKGSSEHGPHAIVLAPDGKSLYVIAGNLTDPPTDIKTYNVPKTWREDLLLPRNPCPSGHNTGRLAPGGWICRVSPNGKQWDLVSTGFRNPYDMAFNREGDLFTFDADMEYDFGKPWYRPTRICHVTSGAEFGWRFGSGKWPAYNADSLPAMLDIGLGCPTGVAFGYGADFPAKYQEALFVCDWTHGRLFAVHLEPKGATYSAEYEEFISGTPLPLTDLFVNPVDKAMYFTIGGRQTQSGLYRVTWKGETSTAEIATTVNATELHLLRKQLEAYHGPARADALDFLWKYLGHEDRFIRYAARIALEHQDVDLWQARVFEVSNSEEHNPETTITGLLALSRIEGTPVDKIVSKAIQLWDSNLSDRQRTDLLRALAVTFSRQGNPDLAAGKLLAEKIADSYPAKTQTLNYELCQMLVYLDSPAVVPVTIALMQQAKTQEDLLNYAMSLRVAKSGWTDKLRTQYLTFLNEAEGKAATGDYVGAGHVQAVVQQMRADATARMTADEKERFADLLNSSITSVAPTGSPTPRKFVKSWTVDDLLPQLEKVGHGRSFENGKSLFRKAECIACHRFDNRGGIFGPDLTAVAKRYSRPVLLREIVTPSVQISDQFQNHLIVTSNGLVHSGRILERGETQWTIAVDPRQPSAVIQLAAEDIEEAVPSTVSMMPTHLLDTLSQEEILDLLAYLESAGDPKHGAFEQLSN